MVVNTYYLIIKLSHACNFFYPRNVKITFKVLDYLGKKSNTLNVDKNLVSCQVYFTTESTKCIGIK